MTSKNSVWSNMAEKADFENLVAEVKKLMPDEEVAKQLEDGLRSQFEKPIAKEVSQTLGRDFTDDEVRQLQFFPTPQDMSEYNLLIVSPPTDSPKEHHQNKVQRAFMPILYLSHIRNGQLAKCFVLTGGLRVLVDLLVHGNLYLRGQAFECFMEITGSEELDWFGPPKDYQPLFERMSELATTPLMVNLKQNYNNEFPGSSQLALQLFAFYTSWIRQFYCKDNVLRLSSELLQLLHDWSERTDVSEQERHFAKQVYDDFRRFPAADDTSADTSTLTTSSASLVPLTQGQRAESHKEAGNKFFKTGKYAEAISKYTDAIQLEPRAPFYSNRAACYLKLAESGGKKEHAENAYNDCQAGLELDQDFVKLYYRKAQAAHLLGKLDDAVQSARMASEKNPNDEVVAKFLQSLEKERREKTAYTASPGQIEALTELLSQQNVAPAPATASTQSTNAKTTAKACEVSSMHIGGIKSEPTHSARTDQVDSDDEDSDGEQPAVSKTKPAKKPLIQEL